MAAVKNKNTDICKIDFPVLCTFTLAIILEELSEQIDINNQFAPLATYVKKVVWQRLGYILENNTRYW